MIQRVINILILVALVAMLPGALVYGQTCGNLVINPITGLLDCAGSSSGGSGVTSITGSNGVGTSSGSAVTTTGTFWADWPRNAQTGTTYTLVTGDRGKVVTFSNATSIAVGIAEAGTTGFEAGWLTVVKNIGAGTVTITPTVSTIDGAATITLVTGDWALISSNGALYETVNNKIVSGAGVNIVAARTGKQAVVDTAVQPTSTMLQNGDPFYCITATSTTAYTCSLTPAATSGILVSGAQIRIKMHATNTGSPTIDINGQGAKPIYKRNGTSASSAAATGELLINQTYVLTYTTSVASGVWETDIGGGGGITALTGDVTASGTGSVAATLASIPLTVNLAAARAAAADFTQFIVREDFCGVNNAGGGIWFGKYSWTVFSSGVSTLSAIRDANDPCIVNLQTGATSTNLARLQQAGISSDATSGTPRINPTLDTNFDFYFVVQLGSTITNADFAVGFCQVSGGYSDCLQQATSTQPGLWFKYSTADSDTNFEFVSCNTGGCTASVTDLGVAPAANTTYRFRVRSTTAGTYLVSVNGGSETSVTPASVANSNMEPFFIVKTETSAARTLQVREMALIWTGRTN